MPETKTDRKLLVSRLITLKSAPGLEGGLDPKQLSTNYIFIFKVGNSSISYISYLVDNLLNKILIDKNNLRKDLMVVTHHIMPPPHQPVTHAQYVTLAGNNPS